MWRTGLDPLGIFGRDAPLELLGAGVRLFKDGRNPKDGQSLAAMRRVPKQSRKRRDRFVLRREALVAALVEAGLMPADEHARRALALRGPYQLRANGLDAALSPHEFGRALFHLHQRRGFKSNRRTDRKANDKDQGKIAEASQRLRDLLVTMNCRTFGEYLWTRHRGANHDPSRPRDPGRQPTRIRLDGEGAKALYAFYPTRDMLRHEFDALWEVQARHHPDLLTPVAREEIATILFRQRELKPPKIGKCTFEYEAGELRLPKALPSVQAREIYERLGHVRLSTDAGSDRPLRPAERDELATALLLFQARHLNETKHMSRIARAYLGKICDPDGIYATPGTLTGLLRGKWGLNSPLSDDNRKDRTDHRHHAIDAITIGAMTRALLLHLNTEAGRAEQSEYDAVLGKIAWPFAGFRDAVREKLEALVVSNKPEHGKTGALHEDTAYGIVADAAEKRQIGNLVRRKPVADLTTGEVDRIRDAELRKAVQAAVAPFRDAKGKASDTKGFAAALVAFAQERNMRRIRVGKDDVSAVAIHDRRSGKPYKAVAPGENHHLDVVQMRDGLWKGFAATVYEVNRNGWRPLWERERLGGKLVMRLHKGDAVELLDGDGERRVKTVVRLEPVNGRIRLIPHNEGGDYQKRHDDPDDLLRWDLASISGLKERGCVALKVNEIGRLKQRRTNI